ncbi:hypothetical protein U9M48_043287 [Paspalum notatum var. saurae]|uniref:Protein kinase domain-containing protein n=1 Tax=Paspalum notatum var. saurae TaxID=547442 RepID=A0AAQ3UUD8_PASNO
MDFELHLLEDITGKFSADHIVGRGGYGIVYRGVYNGEEIAVKRLHQLQGLDNKAFDREFRNLSKVCHPNIVRLIGYCYESRRKFVEHNGENIWATVMERVLCFEYMHGGSLDTHISDESCDLDWPTCYKIIKGTSEGLNHLHSAQQGEPIYHLDLKPANILLDKDCTPKIADLGLSRLVASTETHRTQTRLGTLGYMPPEYINSGDISPKFDVFSLGIIIIKIMAGNTGYSRSVEMPPEQFIELVAQDWKTRLQSTSTYSSQEIDILRVKTCVGIALRCVHANRKSRPPIKMIVNELEVLEAEVKKMMSMPSDDQSKDLIEQRISESNVLAIDPTMELRFAFEPRKDISCCLQLTNKTDGSIAYNIKINQTKYLAKPSMGIMPPCSKCYISVTLRAQEEAPPNMECHDMFLVQSLDISKEQMTTEITKEFFKKVMVEKLVDTVKLPIVYVALE